MNPKNPPFTITTAILALCQKISHELGILEGSKMALVPVQLRKNNKIRTIQATLAIEGNTLTLEQVTDLLNGKRIQGTEKEILEVKNASTVYTKLQEFDALSSVSFKKAHKLLMNKLVPDNGQWRKKGVGIYKGKNIAHVPPQANRVALLIEQLFRFINNKDDIPWIIKGCIFHYELEFIHPFTDGNGRMGRLWQQLIFMKENPIFQYISIEAIIKQKQKQYYNSLSACDKAGDSTIFVEFSLKQTLAALKEYSRNSLSKVIDSKMRLQYAKEKLNTAWFSRKDYLAINLNIATATASRDLEKGLQLKLLTTKGAKNLAQYQFI